MATAEYTKILREAGLTPELCVKAVGQFLQKNRRRTPAATSALSEAEMRFLEAHGAKGVRCHPKPTVTASVDNLAAEYAALIGAALNQASVADLFGLQTSRISQLASAKELYVIEGPEGRVFPRWQFLTEAELTTLSQVDEGSKPIRPRLPHLKKLLTELDSEVHPITVERFFNSPNGDLFSDSLDKELTPREWLITGHSLAPLLLLVQEL